MIEESVVGERILIRDLDKLVEKREVRLEMKYLIFAGALVLMALPLAFYFGYYLGGLEEYQKGRSALQAAKGIARAVRSDAVVSTMMIAQEQKGKSFVKGSVLPAVSRAEKSVPTAFVEEIKLPPRRMEFPSHFQRNFKTAKIAIPLEKKTAAAVNEKEANKAALAQNHKKIQQETTSAQNQTQLYSVQVRSYHDIKLAHEFASELKGRGYQPEITEFVNQNGEKYFRVRIGTYRELDEAKRVKSKLLEKEGLESMVISLK